MFSRVLVTYTSSLGHELLVMVLVWQFLIAKVLLHKISFPKNVWTTGPQSETVRLNNLVKMIVDFFSAKIFCVKTPAINSKNEKNYLGFKTLREGRIGYWLWSIFFRDQWKYSCLLIINVYKLIYYNMLIYHKINKNIILLKLIGNKYMSS